MRKYLFLSLLGGQNLIWIFSNISCLLSRAVWWVVQICSFGPKLKYFTDQNVPKEGWHKNEFWLFSNTKMNVTVRTEKVSGQNGVICLVSMFPSWVMVLKMSKTVYFLKVCADLSKKSTSIKAIYIYASERSCHTLSENDIVCYDITYFFEDIRVLSRRIFLNLCWVSIVFDFLIANISWLVAETPSNHIFWKSVMRSFRSIYVNCFYRLRFLAEVSTNCQKYAFLGNLRTITQETNIETRQMNPSFSSTFPAVAVCKIHFWIWRYSEFIFMYLPHGPFWSVKYINFLVKSYRFGQLIKLF